MARNFTTESWTTAASTNFSLCVAMLTLAHATVEGKNAEKLKSAEDSGKLFNIEIKRIIMLTTCSSLKVKLLKL